MSVAFEIDPQLGARTVGLIVLQADETIEAELSGYFKENGIELLVSRIASSPEVNTASLARMEGDLASAASLFPSGKDFPVIGYACTSASAVIGAEKVSQLVGSACSVGYVTNPLTAAINKAERLGLKRLALLSPYIAEVNAPLRQRFADVGISTDVFASFNVAEERTVARISESSITDAGIALGSSDEVDGLFISCTNLRTFNAIPVIEEAIGKPVLSSNSVLAWHMKNVALNSNAVAI